jgi:hypothetical protein
MIPAHYKRDPVVLPIPPKYKQTVLYFPITTIYYPHLKSKMKFTIPILASLVATSTALFDKNQRMNIPTAISIPTH